MKNYNTSKNMGYPTGHSIYGQLDGDLWPAGTGLYRIQLEPDLQSEGLGGNFYYWQDA